MQLRDNFGSFKAIDTRKLDLPSLPNLCRELVKHWKAIRQYLTTHTHHQGMQGVHNQVQSFEWSIICEFFFVTKLEFFQRIIGDCEYAVSFHVGTLRRRSDNLGP